MTVLQSIADARVISSFMPEERQKEYGNGTYSQRAQNTNRKSLGIISQIYSQFNKLVLYDLLVTVTTVVVVKLLTSLCLLEKITYVMLA